MSSVRIGFIASRLVSSGPTSQLLNIVANLDRRNFDPVVITLSGEERDTEADGFRSQDVPMYSLRLPRLAPVWQGRDLLTNTLYSLGIELAHSQGLRADCLAAKLPPTIAAVATIRNYPYDDYPAKYGRLKGRGMAFTHLRALRSLPCVVACSAAVGSRVARHGVRSTVIHNGVDIDRFRPARDGEKARLRSELALPLDAEVFVSVGTLVRRKDPLTVIRAFRSCSVESAVLVLVGDGPLLAKCHEAAGRDPRIRLCGQVEDVSDYLRAADGFVSASRSEGLPNAVLEALSCGLPVLASAIGAHREILEIDESAGRMFSPGDVPGLARLFEGTGTGELIRASNGALRIATHFSARRMSHAYQVLYGKLLEAAT